MNYDELLKRAKDNMPEVVYEKERFEIPKVRGHIEGSKTIISNIQVIATTLQRPLEHILKYLLRELATPGEIKKNGLLVFKSKTPASRINEKIKQYAHRFVLCPSCGKPDTTLQREGAFTNLVCQACGAKAHVKSTI